MPTTWNPAATSKAAVTDESTPPDIATTMRWPAGAPGRSMSASGCKAHCPEIGLEPGGGGKCGGQRGKAALAAAPLELLVERRRGLAREALVLGPGIHVEPFAIGIVVTPGRRVCHPLGGDLGVADDARRQRDFEIEPIAGETAVEDEARIGDRLQSFRLLRHRRLGETPAAAVVDVLPDFGFERRGDQGLRPAPLRESLRFVDRQPPGAGKM